MTFLLLYITGAVTVLAYVITNGADVSAYLEEARRRAGIKRNTKSEMTLTQAMLILTLGWPYIVLGLFLAWWMIRRADKRDAIKAAYEKSRREMVARYDEDTVLVFEYIDFIGDERAKAYLEALRRLPPEKRREHLQVMIERAQDLRRKMRSV